MNIVVAVEMAMAPNSLSTAESTAHYQLLDIPFNANISVIGLSSMVPKSISLILKLSKIRTIYP
jgi:hypothetical protein